ncbi:hypothetical protein CERSUDRAFT_114748 [Gelatoporia subvermispora B]|uniref:BTB domain-containing protein n=1 Tax=Ceriporiopsis subvermispora (strain B) TaxID=914234 RepID=M2QIH2_CERS8|nr:hypothetical protein CERSUDRAFT_114748 [Gelatoporia subvermispora B]
MVTKSPRFFCDDQEAVVFKVEDTLFRVHPYLLKRDSEVFRDMFSMPPGKVGAEGTSEDKPIIIPGITSHDFECLLDYLHNGMYRRQEEFSLEEWSDLLSISSRLLFDNLRQVCLANIERAVDQLDPVQRIVLAQNHDIPQWLESAYIALCVRSNPLDDAEAAQLGFETAFHIARLREQCFRETLDHHGVLLSCKHHIYAASCLTCPERHQWRNIRARFQPGECDRAKILIARTLKLPDPAAGL